MTKLTRIAALLSGSVLVALACSAEKALEQPQARDGGILDALTDALSPSDALADVTTPGTRLRPRRAVYKGADGSVVEAWAGTWTDLDRKEVCDANTLAADGSRRCLPAARDVAVPGYYTDAKCTVPAFVRPARSPAAKYLLTPDPSGGNRWQVYPIETGLGSDVYTTAGGSGCSGPGMVSSTEGVLVKVGAQLPPSAFVAVERTETDD